jgi:hypothetical protein
MEENLDPADALALVADAGERMAARNPTPRWYAPLYGLFTGGVVAGAGLDQPLGILVLAISVGCIAILYRTWSDAAGITLNGYRPGRTRWIAIGLAAVLVLLMLAGLALRISLGLGWAPLACGAIGAVAAALASVSWDRAWRAELRKVSK